MIPKQFDMMGRTYTVEVLSKEEWQDMNVWGHFDPERSLVQVLDLPDRQVTEQTFFHEIVHVILTAMGHTLNQDEAFVDFFAGMIHQMLKSAKY